MRRTTALERSEDMNANRHDEHALISAGDFGRCAMPRALATTA
jgi:hypothetical protein